MKKTMLTILLISTSIAYGQHFFMTTFLGASAYQGDVQPKALAFFQSKPAFGGGFDYEIHPHLNVKLEFTVARIGAADFYNNSNKARNLSFKSDIYELSLIAEYNVLDLNKYPVTPYFYFGAAFFKFTPFVDLENGSRAYLPDFDTEGQTFYLDRKKYKLNEWSIPFGGGIQWALSNNVRLGWTIGLRKTNTDYLDDVSTTYVDQNLLQQNRGSLAVSYAYKGDQLPNGAPYPAAGTSRGNPSDKDSYIFMGLSLRFQLNPKGRTSSSAERTKIPKSRITCPKVF